MNKMIMLILIVVVMVVLAMTVTMGMVMATEPDQEYHVSLPRELVRSLTVESPCLTGEALNKHSL